MAIKEEKKCNELTGKEWLQNSFSIWRNLTKTKEEKALPHPASFPISLCEKVIKTFSPMNATVIDPFVGVGSTIVAAASLHRKAVGIDLSSVFCDIASSRISGDDVKIYNGNCADIIPTLSDNSFDLCFTSPPYWDILNMKHSADKKVAVNYSDHVNDLGNISDYATFLEQLGHVFALMRPKLKEKAYCIVNVMDLRKKSVFFPFHIDFTAKMKEIGYTLDDMIIWDRQQEYNNMRPLGYPYKFRINKVHEYLLIFTK